MWFETPEQLVFALSLFCSCDWHELEHGRTTSLTSRGTWWRLIWVDDFQPEGRGLDSRSSRHMGTLDQSFTYSCLCASAWNSDTVSCCSRESLWVVVDLKGCYKNGQNEWMSLINDWKCSIQISINLPGLCWTMYSLPTSQTGKRSSHQDLSVVNGTARYVGPT